jgi:Reverse transcriptase (RNA-dependent DNA polymerase)
MVVDLARILNANSFLKCATEPCLFVRTMERSVMIVAVYVDDICAALPTVEDRVTVRGMLGKQLLITDLGEPQKTISRQFSVDDNRISIQQANFFDKIVEHYKKTALTEVRSPIALGTLLHETSSD